MNRFGAKTKKASLLSNLLLPVGFFFFVALTLFWGMGSLNSVADTEQLRSAEQAIRRAAVHCYSIEGRYPSSLEYLVERYGILIDEERFLVHYESIGANIMPTIVVIPTEGTTTESDREVL